MNFLTVHLITPSKQFLRLKPIKKCLLCLENTRFMARNVTKIRKRIFCSLLYLEFYLAVQSDRSLSPQKSSFRDAAQQYRFIKIMFETVKQMLILDSPSKRNRPKSVLSFSEEEKNETRVIGGPQIMFFKPSKR